MIEEGKSRLSLKVKLLSSSMESPFSIQEVRGKDAMRNLLARNVFGIEEREALHNKLWLSIAMKWERLDADEDEQNRMIEGACQGEGEQLREIRLIGTILSYAGKQVL